MFHKVPSWSAEGVFGRNFRYHKLAESRMGWPQNCVFLLRQPVDGYFACFIFERGPIEIRLELFGG